MKVVKLTSKAQKIVNQIMAADAVEIEHGPRINRAYTENTLLSNKGIQFSVEDDKHDGFIEISNNTLNKAEISGDIIVIDANNIEENEYGSMTIVLYSLVKLAAV